MGLKSGAIQAATVNGDEALIAEKEGLRTLTFLGDLFPYPFQGFMASDKKIAKRPGDIKRWLRAMMRALMFIRERPEEAADIAMKKIPMGSPSRPIVIEGIRRFVRALARRHSRRAIGARDQERHRVRRQSAAQNQRRCRAGKVPVAEARRGSQRRVGTQTLAQGATMYSRCCRMLPVLLVLSLLSAQLAWGQEKKNLRVVFVSLAWNAQLPFRVANHRGYFRDQGLTVEQIFVSGGPTAVMALVSGNIDFATIGGAQAAIRSKARGLDMNIIASTSNYTNYTLIGNKDIKRIEDLRGKIVGITGAGSFSDFTVRLYLKRNNLEPDKDVTLRSIGQTVVRASALEKGLIAAAPFSAEDTVKLLDKGFAMIANFNEALRVPQSVYVSRGEMLEKSPDTTKRFLKALILGMQFAKFNKQEAIKIGFAAGLQGDPEIVQRSYDLFSPGYAADMSVAWDGIQTMLDDDHRTGLVDKKFTLDRVVNDRILKQAQQELKNEGRLKQ